MKVLIVEDLPKHVSRLMQTLSAEDNPTVCNTFDQAARFIQRAGDIEWPDLVLLDAMFPFTEGAFAEFMADRFLDQLQRVADDKRFRQPGVILVSRDGRVTTQFERIEQWLNSGVLLDVIEKGIQPIFETLLRHKVDRCRPMAQLRSAGYADAVASLEAHGIVTRDPDLAAYLWFEIRTAATSGEPTWITGEKGTGKDGIAHAISMIRGRRPALVFNCNTAPGTLFQSELFGTVPGAADGAVDRKSRFEEAADGVLFLDEFCSMPFEHQRILNQVAEHRGFSRLGENVVRRATCKFVVADLLTPDAATDSGRLLPDVRDRLVGGVIVTPPLRDRINDIPALVEHFRQQANQTYQKRVVFDAEVAKTFMRGAWPGNIRMLQKIVHRIVLTCEGRVEWEQVLRCFDGYPETLEREMRPPSSRAAQGSTVSASRALPSGTQELLVLLSTEIEVQDPWSWRALVSRAAGDAEERRLFELVGDALKQDAQPLLEQLKLKLRARGNTPRPLYHYQVLLYLAIHPKHRIDRARIGTITGLDSDQMRGDIGTSICLPSTNDGGSSDTDGPSWLVSCWKEGKKLIYRLNPSLLPQAEAAVDAVELG